MAWDNCMMSPRYIALFSLWLSACVQTVIPMDRTGNPQVCEDTVNTCAAKKKTCGSFVNSCGVTIYCDDIRDTSSRDVITGACVTYKSCDDLGRECGTLTQGKNRVSCGQCQADETCGRTYTCIPFTAGSGTSCPAPKCPVGAQCGTVNNDCGMSVDCGTADGVCATPTDVCRIDLEPTDPKYLTCCTPKTAAEICPQLNKCGLQDNGCGGMVDCSKVLCGKDDDVGVCDANGKCATTTSPTNPGGGTQPTNPTTKPACPAGAHDAAARNAREAGTLPQFVADLRANTCEPSCAALIVWNANVAYKELVAPYIDGGFCATSTGRPNPYTYCTTARGTAEGQEAGTAWDTKDAGHECPVCCLTKPGPLNDKTDHRRQ